MLEEELRKIDEEYRSNYIEYTEDILADKILSAAESIQQLAQTFGNDDINLSLSIDRLKELKSEFNDDDTHSETMATSESEPHMPEETSLPAKNSVTEMAVDTVECDPCFGTLNAVPKIKFKSEKDVYNTNSRRNALGSVACIIVFHLSVCQSTKNILLLLHDEIFEMHSTKLSRPSTISKS